MPKSSWNAESSPNLTEASNSCATDLLFATADAYCPKVTLVMHNHAAGDVSLFNLRVYLLFKYFLKKLNIREICRSCYLQWMYLYPDRTVCTAVSDFKMHHTLKAFTCQKCCFSVRTSHLSFPLLLLRQALKSSWKQSSFVQYDYFSLKLQRPSALSTHWALRADISVSFPQ